MKRFHFTAVTAEGETESGTVHSNSMDEALKTIAARRLTVLEMHENGASPTKPWYLRDIQLGSSALSISEAAVVARHVSLFLGARFTLPQALRMAADLSTSTQNKTWLLTLSERVSEGMTFSAAIAQSHRQVPRLFVLMAEVGQSANAMPEAMMASAQYFTQQATQSAKLKSGLVYPLILVLASLAVLAIVTFVLVPAVSPIFEANGQDMPWLIAILARIGSASREDVAGASVALSLIALAVFGLRRPIGRIALSAPGLRGFVAVANEVSFASHARVIALLAGAGETGVGLFSKLRSASNGTDTSDLFERAEEEVRQGRKASKVFSQSAYVPSVFSELYAAGEQANDLGPMMVLAAEVLEGRVKQKTEQILQLLTPVMTLIIGIFIGGVVYAVMGAILDVSTFSL